MNAASRARVAIEALGETDIVTRINEGNAAANEAARAAGLSVKPRTPLTGRGAWGMIHDARQSGQAGPLVSELHEAAVGVANRLDAYERDCRYALVRTPIGDRRAVRRLLLERASEFAFADGERLVTAFAHGGGTGLRRLEALIRAELAEAEGEAEGDRARLLLSWIEGVLAALAVHGGGEFRALERRLVTEANRLSPFTRDEQGPEPIEPETPPPREQPALHAIRPHAPPGARFTAGPRVARARLRTGMKPT